MQKIYPFAEVPARSYQGFTPLVCGTANVPMTRPVPIPAPVKKSIAEHHRKKKYTILMLLVFDVILATFFCMFNTAAAYANEDMQARRELVISETQAFNTYPNVLLVDELQETYVPDFKLIGDSLRSLDLAIDEARENASEIIVIEDDETPLAQPASSVQTETNIASNIITHAISEEPAPSVTTIETSISTYHLPANTLDVNGTWVPYIHCVKAPACPDNGAGLWEGDDSTTDGSYAYFVGHNPGDFRCVYELCKGQSVAVTDCNGAMHNYIVEAIYEVPDDISFDEVKVRLIPDGECIVLQTCIAIDGDHYRIVVCR